MPAQVQIKSPTAGIRVEQNAYRRCFPIGAVFAARVTFNTSAFLSVSIPAGTSLTVTTANNTLGVDSATLFIVEEEEGQLMPLCCIQKESTVAGLGLTWVGPQDIQLRASGGDVNLVGSVAPSTYEYNNLPLMEDTEQHIENDSLLEKVSSETKRETKKRKMSDSEHPQKVGPIVNDEESNEGAKGLEVTAPDAIYNGEEQAPQLSKKQRKKLAKQNAK
jgi:hypothetical protein